MGLPQQQDYTISTMPAMTSSPLVMDTIPGITTPDHDPSSKPIIEKTISKKNSCDDFSKLLNAQPEQTVIASTKNNKAAAEKMVDWKGIEVKFHSPKQEERFLGIKKGGYAITDGKIYFNAKLAKHSIPESPEEYLFCDDNNDNYDTFTTISVSTTDTMPEVMINELDHCDMTATHKA